VAAARARLAADGRRAPMIRALSRWATVAMVAVAGSALVYFASALLPLADLWSAHRPGAGRAALAAALRTAAWVALGTGLAVAAVAVGGWAARARSNLAAFGAGSRRLARGSVGRSPAIRRRMTALVWLLRAALFAGCAAALLGHLAGLDNAAEIGQVRAQAAAGRPVEHGLADHLFGRQLVLRLPGAALLVLAAALAVLLIGRVTSAQYGRVAHLRGTLMVPAAADGGTIGA
jgi:hypothetical protein